MKKLFVCSLLMGTLGSLHAEPLNMTISGKAAEKIPLETLVPSPDIPTAEQMSLSLDHGAAAAGEEIVPLSVSKASLEMDLTKLPMPGLSAIPNAPYIVQALPSELLRQRDNKLKRGEPRIRFTHWDFSVVDEMNIVWHEESGDGFPPPFLTWDGTREGQFVLKPNRTYFSIIKLSAHGEPDHTIVGESVRFMAFLHQSGPDTIVELGERIYKREEAEFSEEAQIYIDDLASRLSHNMAFYDEKATEQWRVVLAEPAERQNLGDKRKRLWETHLEVMLGKPVSDDRITIQNSDNGESSVAIIFPNTNPPATDQALRGEAQSQLRPVIDEMASLVKISETKRNIVVDLRHDRIFLPGSAYVKDSSLPYLTVAMKKVQEMISDQEKQKGEAKKLLLRSYTQILPTDKDKEETDPKLTATRSKVLFMMFSRGVLTSKKN